jgi:hypothetical protein
MSEFTKRAALSERSLEFNFRNIYNAEGDKYFVIVKEGGAEIGKFEMLSNSTGKWRVADPAPPWVKEFEAQIVTMAQNPHDEHRTYRLRHDGENDSRRAD